MNRNIYKIFPIPKLILKFEVTLINFHLEFLIKKLNERLTFFGLNVGLIKDGTSLVYSFLNTNNRLQENLKCLKFFRKI